MEYEIELKLLTHAQAGQVITDQLLPQLKAQVHHQRLVLTNHYFDTPDRVLRQHDIGLRIRGHNQSFEQTLKTAGKSVAGLHQRPEYNVDLGSAHAEQAALVPRLNLFPASAWPQTLDVQATQSQLELLFTTHFTRESFLLELSEEEHVELVWDLGEVRSGKQTQGICEIELELKKGHTKSLFELAKKLVQLLPTNIGIDSKAARGYKLLQASQTVNAAKSDRQNQAQDLPANGESLEVCLQSWQRCLINLREGFDLNLAQDALQKLKQLVALWQQFSGQFDGAEYSNLTGQLEQFLDAYQFTLKAQHPDDLLDLVSSHKATIWQLEMLQLLLEKPWLD
ncbi:CYTH domain-containing protein [Paraglaciecola aestuariivivens]